MTELITLLALVGIAFLLISWPRLTSKSRIIRRIYRHVDDPLGATRFENNRRASRRRVLAFFSLGLANLVYPVTQYGGVNALPSTGRMRRYVQLEFSQAPVWPRLWRVWHVEAVTLRWTSEANALGQGFGDLLARKVAQALILKSPADLEQHPAFDQGYFEVRRTKPARDVPSTVPFGEATDE
ncbi:MAG TPA: hypothetical protein VHM23_27360 [Actinomycetota bacterium]|jgi:hypothetical protein|nr:hypothetical protein [Actinomycetota bacterium]